jgi:hypothetical protein
MMIRSIVAGLMLGGMMFSGAGLLAAPTFDGNWSVLIVTDRGQCDPAYRYGLVIRNGQVIYEGDASVNVAGRVSGNGAVSVRVSAGSQSANGTGRLSSAQGGGTWRGNGSSGMCSGTWSAERR